MAYTSNGKSSSLKKQLRREILPSATRWMKLEGIMLSEISQTETNTAWCHSYVGGKTKLNSEKQRLARDGRDRDKLVKGYKLLVIR